MRSRCMLFAALVMSALMCTPRMASQDAPSLGDLARQQRQQRQQAKTAGSKDSTQPKVFTNADLPMHSDSSAEESNDSAKPPMPIPTDGTSESSERIRSQVQEQESRIASLQNRIDEVNGSIHFASGNCARNCAAWNEHQEKKQREVERMRAELDEQKRNLEQMQNTARKQGFGSSVYDP